MKKGVVHSVRVQTLSGAVNCVAMKFEPITEIIIKSPTAAPPANRAPIRGDNLHTDFILILPYLNFGR